MKGTIILLISYCFALFCSPIKAQDEKASTFCTEISDKKAIANYEKGKDRKKYKKPERLQFLLKALELEPDFAEANLAMGLELAARSKLENKPFAPTVPYFYKAIAVCPKIHSEPYYYIGFDYYEKAMNDSAIKYLQKFLDFKDDDEKKYAADFAEEQYQAKMMIRSAKKEMGLRKNVQFDPHVVKGVSTERDEYLAYISPDDKQCFFVRRLPVKNLNQVYTSDGEKEVFMQAVRTQNGEFTAGEPLSSPFNETDDNQGGCTITIDNKFLYFAMMRMEGGLQPNCDIYVCDFNGEYWGEIRKVSPLINDPKYWDSQPSISADGNSLYFASDRPGGYGGIDIYVSKKNRSTGQWGVPQNLGPMINTPGDEKTPFIHSDSETLYFSSNGHFGFGEYDIFYARQNEKGEWQEPENIGSPINGLTDDTGFFVSSDAKTGYFFSYNEGKVNGRGVGRYDLFSFDLYKEARPNQVAFVKGNLKKNDSIVNGAVVELKDVNTKKVSYALIDSTSGEFMAAVKKESNVLLTVKKDGLAFNSTLIKSDELPAPGKEPLPIALKLSEAKEGESFVINNLYYATNSAEIKAESKVVLENFAEYLIEYKSMVVEIQGHTDNVGSLNDNMALSSNRAYSVKTLLEEFGVESKRITAKGFGPTVAVSDNATEQGRALNRRTEFKIIKR
ncbi:MAG: OmpA family protein [Bacteroidia bacterium]|jgi:outer membrane protein OmpA-like peptidoglycan-associated protein|nr:OmpA family protein [Bacteroidia bacterium]